MMKRSILVQYRERGSTNPWREIRLSLDADETTADRINRFEDENFGVVEVAPSETQLRLIDSRQR